MVINKITDDVLKFDPNDELEKWIIPIPLSNPVMTAIFQCIAGSR